MIRNGEFVFIVGSVILLFTTGMAVITSNGVSPLGVLLGLPLMVMGAAGSLGGK